jgi:rhodanese-related sulfurtransferase
MPNSAPQGPGQITVTDAYDRARAGEAVLLDVREADEYSAGHVPGSTWQPLGAARMYETHAVVTPSFRAYAA